MTKTKSTKRSLLASALALLMCVSMLIGSTFAWFTDSVTSGNNKIVAGNLDVEVYYGDPAAENSIQDVSTLFNDVKLWEPGAVAYENLTVVNKGSLALKYQLSINYTNENTVVDAEGNDTGRGLSDILQVAVVEDGVDTTKTRDEIVAGITNWAPMADWADVGNLTAEGTEGDEATYGVVIWWEPSAEDNNWNVNNGKTTSDDEALHIDLGVTLLATQDTVESDSFNNQYDAGASFDDVIFALGGTYNMDADRNEGINISPDAQVIINGNDYAINVGGRGFQNSGDATVNNVEMNAGTAAIYSNATSGADAKTTYNNVTIKSAGGGIGAANGAEVIFNSGSVEVNTTSTSGRYLFYAEGEGTVITINGGEFADFTQTTQNQKRAYIYAGAGTTVNVNGGTFGKASTRDGYTDGILGDGTVIITGGTFGFDPSTWVADGYEAVPHGTNWYVLPQNSTVVANDTELQTALNSATDGSVIYLIGDITGDVTATQKSNVKITIDGNGNTLKGTITVDGGSTAHQDSAVTIKNVKFVTDTVSTEACVNMGVSGNTSTRYIYNLTVENCYFNVPGKVAVKSYGNGDKNLKIIGCTVAEGMHSLLQVNNVAEGLQIKDCKVYSKNGINVNQSENVTISGCEVDVSGYAVRYGASSGTTGAAETYSIENCTLKSANADGDATVILRGTAESATLTITNTTITGNPDITNTANATVVR